MGGSQPKGGAVWWGAQPWAHPHTTPAHDEPPHISTGPPDLQGVLGNPGVWRGTKKGQARAAHVLVAGMHTRLPGCSRSKPGPQNHIG